MATELHKLKTADIRGLEASQLRETEQEIRRELVKIRMDIYTAKSASGSKIRGLKTSLARLLTVATEKGLKKVAVKAPAAPKAAKPAKAAAPKAAKPAKAEKAPAAAAKKPAKAKTSKK